MNGLFYDGIYMGEASKKINSISQFLVETNNFVVPVTLKDVINVIDTEFKKQDNDFNRED